MNLKKVCYTAFVAFWSSIVTLLALYSLADDEGKLESAKKISLAQIAEHNTQQDCWMAISGKVYDLTTYLSQHPAPPTVMLPWCGKEATEGMRTKGYSRDHSPQAWNLLTSYLIGELEQ